jgi:hypothetical protein
MSDTRKAAWHMLPEPVKQQATTRWPSGMRAAGPGDGYVYVFSMVLADGHQLALLPVTAAHGLAHVVPRLVGRRLEQRPKIRAPKTLDWSRVRL